MTWVSRVYTTEPSARALSDIAQFLEVSLPLPGCSGTGATKVGSSCMGNYYVPNTDNIVLKVTRTLGRILLSGASHLTIGGETVGVGGGISKILKNNFLQPPRQRKEIHAWPGLRKTKSYMRCTYPFQTVVYEI